jgi:hypothetical protein
VKEIRDADQKNQYQEIAFFMRGAKLAMLPMEGGGRTRCARYSREDRRF